MEKPINKTYAYPNGSAITFRQIRGSEPAVFYMHGTRSSIDSTKAKFVENFCLEKGIAFTSLNFRGHGNSSGNFVDFTISDWCDDALAILDNFTHGRQIIIGSSMGGWIMLLLALKRPNRVHGLIGISAAPDFTQMILDLLPDDMIKQLYEKKVIYTPNDYDEKGDPWTLKFLEDGKKNLVLGDEIRINAPVILLHGDCDTVVPMTVAKREKEVIKSPYFKLLIQKGGKHNLSNPDELAVLAKSIDEIRTCK